LVLQLAYRQAGLESSEGLRTSRNDSHFCAFADSAPLRLCKEALAALHWKAQKTWIPAQTLPE
jgi:hypothetical protein